MITRLAVAAAFGAATLLAACGSPEDRTATPSSTDESAMSQEEAMPPLAEPATDPMVLSSQAPASQVPSSQVPSAAGADGAPTRPDAPETAQP